MSIVTVQLGQCGNQIGSELFEFLRRDALTPPKYSSVATVDNELYEAAVMNTFFTMKMSNLPEAKAVMVDMEPKAIARSRDCARRAGTFQFPAKSEYIQKQGSGNNWALGYHGYGNSVSSAVSELCRKEVEKCDCFAGFFVLMSLAGGTGSGLGTHLTYSLKDLFEDAIITNHVIWPYTSGEVILQNYNSLLTLSHLQQCSDMIMGQQNEHVHSICTKLLGIKNVGIEHLNAVVAHKLASVMQPSYVNASFANPLYDLSTTLTSHPSFKMVALKSIPHIREGSMDFTRYLWPGLLKHLRQMLIADSSLEEGVNWEIKLPTEVSAFTNAGLKQRSLGAHDIRHTFCKSLANVLVLRGKDIQDADATAFQDSMLYSDIIPAKYRYQQWTQYRCFNQYEKCATLLTNSQSFVRPLNMMIDKSWKMFNARAYVHQYEKYGLEVDDFVDSFGVVEQITHDYAHL